MRRLLQTYLLATCLIWLSPPAAQAGLGRTEGPNEEVIGLDKLREAAEAAHAELSENSMLGNGLRFCTENGSEAKAELEKLKKALVFNHDNASNIRDKLYTRVNFVAKNSGLNLNSATCEEDLQDMRNMYLESADHFRAASSNTHALLEKAKRDDGNFTKAISAVQFTKGGPDCKNAAKAGFLRARQKLHQFEQVLEGFRDEYKAKENDMTKNVREVPPKTRCRTNSVPGAAPAHAPAAAPCTEATRGLGRADCPARCTEATRGLGRAGCP